jgi:hypothetical protein
MPVLVVKFPKGGEISLHLQGQRPAEIRQRGKFATP